MRGLKLPIRINTRDRNTSHLLQMRGLKLADRAYFPIVTVASFTDAWIETVVIKTEDNGEQSHLLQMRGLKLMFN